MSYRIGARNDRGHCNGVWRHTGAAGRGESQTSRAADNGYCSARLSGAGGVAGRNVFALPIAVLVESMHRMSKLKTNDVLGRLVYLDETRIVFLGTTPWKRDTWFIRFRNAEGVDTKLALSTEAMRALVGLYSSWSDGDLYQNTFPHKTSWYAVKRCADV